MTSRAWTRTGRVGPREQYPLMQTTSRRRQEPLRSGATRHISGETVLRSQLVKMVWSSPPTLSTLLRLLQTPNMSYRIWFILSHVFRVASRKNGLPSGPMGRTADLVRELQECVYRDDTGAAMYQITSRPTAETGFPVSAIMQRDRIRHARWLAVRWRLMGFVAGARVHDGEPRSSLAHEDESCRLYLWSGFNLRLHRDSAERYWHNLVARQPSLFLICHERPDGEPRPFGVTADPDEASAHMEADDKVYSAALPPEIYRWLETYVVENYRPAPPGKRRRFNWQQESERGGPA